MNYELIFLTEFIAEHVGLLQRSSIVNNNYVISVLDSNV